MLKETENTFSPSREIRYTANDGTEFRFTVLRARLHAGDSVIGRLDTVVETQHPEPEIPFMLPTELGLPISEFPHPLIERSEQLSKAEALIVEADAARDKLKVIEQKWRALNHMKRLLSDQDEFERLLHTYGNPGAGVEKTIIEALGDPLLAKDVNARIGYNNYSRQPNIKPDHEQFKMLASEAFQREYDRVSPIVEACRGKAKACDEYLFTIF